MKKAISKERFLEIIRQRPASIRMLQDPSDDYFASLLVASRCTVLNYLPAGRLTQGLLEAFMRQCIGKYKEEGRHHYFYYVSHVKLWPEEAHRALPDDLVAEFSAIDNWKEYLHTLPYEHYLKEMLSTTWPQIDKVPEKFRTEELMTAAYSMNPERFIQDCPDFKITDKVIDRAIGFNPSMIIPDEFVTKERLMTCLKAAKGEYNLMRVQIKKSVWDKELAMASYKYEANITQIPEKLTTKEMWLEVLADNYDLMKHMPEAFIDKPTLIAALSKTSIDLTPEMDEMVDEDLILQVATAYVKDMTRYGLGGLRSINHKIKGDLWPKVLRICPQAVRLVAKTDQTDDMLDAIIQTTAPAMLDDLVLSLNLTKIKKEHAPFLIGCGDEALQKIAARKFKGASRKSAIEVAGDDRAGEGDVIINVTPGQYEEMAKTFKLEDRHGQEDAEAGLP